MTNTRINASLNTAKEIINALMNSEEIFYDRTEGNELSGRFNVQMTFAESICYRPQYTVRKLRNLVLNRHGWRKYIRLYANGTSTNVSQFWYPHIQKQQHSQ